MADRCRSCDAPIEWAYTPKGSRIPLDPGTRPDGNINVDHDGIAHIVPAGHGTRTTHYADQHRRRHPSSQRQR